MASYLGVGIAGSAPIVLARKVTVDTTTTAAQVIYTGTQAFVPIAVCLRAGATAFGTTTSFIVGATGALFCYVATIVATSLPTTVAFFKTCGSSTASPIAAATTVYFSAVQVDASATAANIDLIGYLL